MPRKSCARKHCNSVQSKSSGPAECLKKRRNRGAKVHKCTFCAYTAPKSSMLQRHIIHRHTQDYPFPCSAPECNYKGKTAYDVKNHQRNRHTALPQISCTFEGCSYKTKFSKKLEYHVLRRHTPTRKKSVDCPLCAQKFFTAYQMTLHLRTHTKEKPWRCSLCDYACATNRLLCFHVESRHGKLEMASDRRVLKCELCDFVTVFWERLREHVYLHSKEQPYACKFSGCSFRSKRRQQLKNHEIISHAPERHPCPHPNCKYIAPHQWQLGKHVTAVHKKEFPCVFPECNRVFSTETVLINHQKIHDPKRLYQCEQCHLRYSTRSFLTCHIRNRHEEEKNLKCPQCDYRTNQRGHLRSHLTRIHQAEKIMCSVAGCNFESCSPYDITHHYNRRHDPRSHPFKCEFCPYGYTNNSGLRSHKLREHSEVFMPLPKVPTSPRGLRTCVLKYDCKLCDYTFTDKALFQS